MLIPKDSKRTMLIQSDSTKSCSKSQTEKFVYAPVSLICDKNITYKERSLMLGIFAYSKESINSDFRFTKISTLARRYSDKKSTTPTKALLKGLKSLQTKGYIMIIDGKYVVILEEKFQGSRSFGLEATPFYSRNININMLGLIAFLNARQPKDINCVGYIAKAVGLDKKTVYKYLSILEKLNFVESRPSSINGKDTPNYHTKKGPVFYAKPKRAAPVDNFGINPVDGASQNSPHRYNYYYIIIKHICNTAKNLDYRNKKEMFTLRDFIAPCAKLGGLPPRWKAYNVQRYVMGFPSWRRREIVIMYFGSCIILCGYRNIGKKYSKNRIDGY